MNIQDEYIENQHRIRELKARNEELKHQLIAGAQRKYFHTRLPYMVSMVTRRVYRFSDSTERLMEACRALSDEIKLKRRDEISRGLATVIEASLYCQVRKFTPRTSFAVVSERSEQDRDESIDPIFA